jgi:hypothetical protein
MELNGLANISILVSELKMAIELSDASNQEELSDHIDDIKQQLDLLNRYMTAVGTALEKLGHSTENPVIPMWHEVRETPSEFPTNRERLSGSKYGSR